MRAHVLTNDQDVFKRSEINATGSESRKCMSVTNVVLVHEGWADGSCWSAVIERLQQASYRVTAVQLNLTSLSGDVARVRQVLSAQTSPTILVARSYGGAVITGLGKDTPSVRGQTSHRS